LTILSSSSSSPPSSSWEARNQKYLSSNIDFVIDLLQRYILKVNENNKNKIIRLEERERDEEEEEEEERRQQQQQQQKERQQAEFDKENNNDNDFSFKSNLEESEKKNNDGDSTHKLYSSISYTSSTTSDSSFLSSSSTSSLQPSLQHPPAALETVVNLFGLSEFEKLILVLCAGIELNSKLSQLCKEIHQDVNMAYPTFGIALAALSEPHWSALSPVSPLRRFKLIEVYGYPHQMPLTSSIIRIDERILHYLLGLSYLEKQLREIVKPVQLDFKMAQSHVNLSKHIQNIWIKTHQKKGHIPVIKLTGADKMSKLSIAQTICQINGLALWRIDIESIPLKYEEIDSLIQLWARESALLGAGLCISIGNNNNLLDLSKQKLVEHFIENVPGVLFLEINEPFQNTNLNINREVISFEIKKPLKAEQQDLWKYYLEKECLYSIKMDDDYSLLKLVNQFNMDSYYIQLVCKQSKLMFDEIYDGDISKRNEINFNLLFSVLWDASRIITRPKIDSLAKRIIPVATMDDLILSTREKKLLEEIVLHVKQKNKVYEEWGWNNENQNQNQKRHGEKRGEGKEEEDDGREEDGFEYNNFLLPLNSDDKDVDSTRGMGIAALFAGDSGTGKTMAAEALANELKLDLFHIDLSMVVSKYIGETEKNLRQIFDAADLGSVILFFDEADALFGKRTEVKDSHDRYANIEVGYLLQRMESYKGLAILTTNMKSSLDSAFMRRIRFIVNFQFPDEKSRMEIWKHVFPKSTPKEENIDISFLARLNITGGQIRNIAMNASFLAANQGVSVNMSHIKQSIKTEYNKMERPLTNIEFDD
jgi:hypothetical protein